MELGPSRFREPAAPLFMRAAGFFHVWKSRGMQMQKACGSTYHLWEDAGYFCIYLKCIEGKIFEQGHEEDDFLQRTTWLASKDCLTSMIR